MNVVAVGEPTAADRQAACQAAITTLSACRAESIKALIPPSGLPAAEAAPGDVGAVVTLVVAPTVCVAATGDQAIVAVHDS